MNGMKIDGKFSAMPEDYASLKLNLDFLDAASITFNGSNIASITDKSGTGRNFSQATAGSQPSWTSGVGATFSSDFLECTSNLITDSDGTFVIILRFDRANTQEEIFQQGNAALGDGDGFGWIKNPSASNNNVRSAYRVGTTPGIGTTMSFTGTTTFRIFTFQKNNIFVNTSQETPVLYGTGAQNRWFNDAAGATRMAIGKIAGSSGVLFGNVTIKRISYFNTALSNADIIRIANGLKTYYSI